MWIRVAPGKDENYLINKHKWKTGCETCENRGDENINTSAARVTEVSGLPN